MAFCPVFLWYLTPLHTLQTLSYGVAQLQSTDPCDGKMKYGIKIQLLCHQQACRSLTAAEDLAHGWLMKITALCSSFQ